MICVFRAGIRACPAEASDVSDSFLVMNEAETFTLWKVRNSISPPQQQIRKLEIVYFPRIYSWIWRNIKYKIRSDIYGMQQSVLGWICWLTQPLQYHCQYYPNIIIMVCHIINQMLAVFAFLSTYCICPICRCWCLMVLEVSSQNASYS